MRGLPCCLCGGPVVAHLLEEEEEEAEEGGWPSELDSSSDDGSDGGDEGIERGPPNSSWNRLLAKLDALRDCDSSSDDEDSPSLAPELQWLAGASVIARKGERQPWRCQHPRRDVRAAAAERAAPAAAAPRRADAEGAEGDGGDEGDDYEESSSEDEDGDWQLVGPYSDSSGAVWYKRFLLSDSGAAHYDATSADQVRDIALLARALQVCSRCHGPAGRPAACITHAHQRPPLFYRLLCGVQVQVCTDGGDPFWFTVAGWDGRGDDELEAGRIFDSGGALLVHSHCAGAWGVWEQGSACMVWGCSACRRALAVSWARRRMRHLLAALQASCTAACWRSPRACWCAWRTCGGESACRAHCCERRDACLLRAPLWGTPPPCARATCQQPTNREHICCLSLWQVPHQARLPRHLPNRLRRQPGQHGRMVDERASCRRELPPRALRVPHRRGLGTGGAGDCAARRESAAPPSTSGKAKAKVSGSRAAAGPSRGLLDLDEACLQRVAWAGGRQQGVLSLLRLATTCRRLRAFAAQQLPASPAAWELACRREAPHHDWDQAAAVLAQQGGQGEGSTGSAPAGVDWRGSYAAAARAAEQPDDGLRNALRISGVVQRVLEELAAPDGTA